MSLATNIKDFSDTLNHIHTVKTSSLPILPFLQEILVFTLKTSISGIVYILTFEWFRDFVYLPLINPISQQSFEIANAERLLFPNLTSEYLRDSFFTDQVSHLLSFFNLPANTTNYFLSGITTSFFFSFPFSLPHLISIRRLFSQGIQAAIASLTGIIAAHSLFLISIFYGLRFLIIPWFSLEPITYIFGFTANIFIIKELIQVRPQRFQKGAYTAGSQFFSSTNFFFSSTERVQTSFKKGGQGQDVSPRQFFLFSPFLLRISLLSFILTWCEELNVFSCITNLTFNAQNAYLDLYPSTNVSQFFGIHSIYIFSFIIGNCIFSLFFYYLLFKSGSLLASWTNSSTTKISDAINKLVLLFIITFTFASFPYYGLDYLFGKIGGFLPEDPIYKESVLSPTKLTMNKKNTLFIKAESADKRKHTSLLDVNNFDNGVYLNNVDSYKWDNFPSDSKGSIGRTTSFEKSNYRQENAWIRRNYLARLRARPRKNSDNSNTASFYKTFKDPKAYYQKIQLESDKKQNKKIRKIQSKNLPGYFVKRQEGILAEEPVYKMQDFWDRVFGFPAILNKGQERNTLSSTKKTPFFIDTLFRGKESSRSVQGQLKEQDYRAGAYKTGPYKNDPAGLLVSGSTFFPVFQQNTITSQKEKELDVETNIFAEKYTKGIQKKSSLPLLNKTKSLSTKNIIKRKFFLNPVYRALLQTDIDTFMARQPSRHNIAENQDYDLYKKRILLEKYYNWLRYYSPLQESLQNVYNIYESKSFVDSVFHHQFKGTLKIAKRLFPVTFDAQQNRQKDRVLSYDQSLYKDLPNSENPLLHEELLVEKKVRNANSLKQPFLESSKTLQKRSFCTTVQKQSGPPTLLKNCPFIEESNSAPFYAGWDDTLRRFVITNQFFVDK